MYSIIILTCTLWLLFYFLFLRPKHISLKRRKQEQLQTKAGDWVLLQSGIYAYVVSDSGEFLLVSFNENCNTSMICNKNAVIRRLSVAPEFGELS